jgi:hypothetical protein
LVFDITTNPGVDAHVRREKQTGKEDNYKNVIIVTYARPKPDIVISAMLQYKSE